MNLLERGKQFFQQRKEFYEKLSDFLIGPSYDLVLYEVIRTSSDHSTDAEKDDIEQEHLKAWIQAEVAKQILQAQRTADLKTRYRSMQQTKRSCPLQARGLIG